MPTNTELTPLLVARGAARAIDFYVRALGARVLARYEHGPERHLSHADLALGEARLAVTEEFDALIAIGLVVRGETYHFEIVSNESAAGVSRVALDYGIPIANAILTTENDEQARARVTEKGRDAARVAVEMANLMWSLDEAEEEEAQ